MLLFAIIRPICCAGLANIEGVCDSRRRTAINHESGEYASIQTAAHELGHKSVIINVSCVYHMFLLHVVLQTTAFYGPHSL